MSETPPPDSEVEEGSPFGGPECEDSSPEPAQLVGTEIEEPAENLFPIANLAVEFYEGPDDGSGAKDAVDNSVLEPKIEISSDNVQDFSVENDEGMNVDNSNDATNSDQEIDPGDAYDEAYTSGLASLEPDYKAIQKTYFEDFIYSNTLSNDESSNSNFNVEEGKEEIKGSPLSRFPKIVKSIEYADYETLQVLYQLLYQRSAWDTQEILSQGILEFSGFSFGQNSEDYFNREMMLRTQPNEVLIKIGAILGLDQVQKMLVDLDKGRVDLIQAILNFLSRPCKKTRRSIVSDVDHKKGLTSSPSTATSIKCGCRNRCLKRFLPYEQAAIKDYLKTLEEQNLLESYLISMVELRKIIRPPGSYEDAKKLKEVYYRYKVVYGNKEAIVCKGGFCNLYGLKQGKINALQIKIKSAMNEPKTADVEFPPMPMVDPPPNVKTPKPSTPRKRNRAGPKSAKKAWVSSEEQVRRMESDLNEDKEAEIKSSIEKQKVIPKVVVEKFDIKSIEELKNKLKEDSKSSELKENAAESTEKNEDMKLKDFPLVVKAIETAPEELLIDVHFLLFLSSADVDKIKENILEFGGFTFDDDTEEYDERNEFLQRMSFKIVSDVARSFSLAILSTKEETIKNILTFLTKPNESFLRVNATLPLSLSDVEFDDLGDLSDSDVSITCEVVEKKVECIDLISSGEDSDREDKPRKDKSQKKTSSPAKTPNVNVVKSTPVTTSAPQPPVSQPIVSQPAASQPVVSQPAASSSVLTTPAPAQESQPSSSTGGVRALRNFETICKIVNTHPHEYLVDIFDLLYLRKHEPSTLRSDILDFTGFKFEKGSPDYVKRKQLLDRMLYNSVRRIYNTLIHNTTEVKVFSKPTMIQEIFQFLFKLPDQDTSVRPPPTAKPISKPPYMQGCPVVKNVPESIAPPAGLTLPNQTGKLSDLKRVFQRVACFPCEYLIDVHKLLFMTDCDQKVIRQNIFAFKGFSFSPDSQEFQQRKMYLEYLTFHSLRKISSVLTTRSVDLRNSTKHELATHLTQVLAEYCNTEEETSQTPTTTQNTQPAVVPSTTSALANAEVENIVVTPIIDPSLTGPSSVESSTSYTTITSSTANSTKSPSKPQAASPSLGISISNPRSVSSPAVTTTTKPKQQRKRKSNTISKIIKDKQEIQPQPAEAQSQFADINLPEVEQYRQLYGQNLNIYPTNGPTITGITFNTGGIQAFPQIVPQTVSFPVTYSQVQAPYPVQQPNQIIGINQSLAPKIVTQVPSKQGEIIVPNECLIGDSEEPASKKAKTVSPNDKAATKKSEEANSYQNKIRDAASTEEDEDCDKPLSSLVGHPIDSVLKKHIVDIVEQSDLQSITINGVIQKIFNMYPKFDLSYRKEFIKSALRSILYRLGQKNSESKDEQRDADSPDCSVTTTENCDDNLNESSDTAMECS